MIVFEATFWFSILAILYAYVGYTSLLWVFTRFKENPVRRDDITPSVSLVISAYNEGKIIADKLENSLALSYPNCQIEIAVISDGSTDDTPQIIRAFSEEDIRIVPFILPTNRGKTHGLNECVPRLKGEIVVFSDANCFYEPDTIRRIVRPFADETIGFVSGSTVYTSAGNGSPSSSTSKYATLERITKALESKVGSCIGADGAIFAIRRRLFEKLSPDDINDFVIPLRIMDQDYRGIQEDVICREGLPDGDDNQFKRQVRITTRTLRAIFRYRKLLNPMSHPLISFGILSHKVAKYITPFWLILIIVSNLFLAFNGNAVYTLTLLIQGCIYFAVLLGLRDTSEPKVGYGLNAIRSFLIVNTAYLVAWYRAITGYDYRTWVPSRH